MNDLKPEKPPELSFTLTIKRAGTGEIVTVPMVGHIVTEQQPVTEKESQDGRNP